MKMPYHLKIRRFIMAAALSTGLGFVSPAFAIAWLVGSNGQGLTKLTLGGDTEAFDINDKGQVVGGFITTGGKTTHAFITGPNGVGITDLGTLGGGFSGAYGINESGQAVGYSTTTNDAGPHAFITGPNGVGMTDLGTGYAYGINDAGQVVGQSGGHAFITGPNGVGRTDLGGDDISAIDINNAGQVVIVSGSSYESFITGPNGVSMTKLSTLGGCCSTAFGINDAGRVVGYSQTDNEQYRPHAFITGPDGAGMTDLGTLPGGTNSFAYDINDAGQVVGSSLISSSSSDNGHAFITGPNGVGMTDLNSLVSLPDGTVIGGATGINNLGQVIVNSPIPEPATYALMLAGLGLLGSITRRRKIA